MSEHFIRKRMLKSQIKSPVNIVLVLFSLLAFMLPVYKKPIPLIIVLLLVVLIYYTIREKTFRSFRLTTVSAASIGLYLLYAIGLLYTENMKSGLFDMEVKMSFLIFPLIFALAAPFIKTGFRAQIEQVFIAGVLFSSLLSLTMAAIRYSESQNIQEFFYIHFSRQFHPSYFAMYVNVALLLLMNNIFKQWFSFRKSKIAFLIVLCAFLIFIVFLANSKAGIIVTLISMLLFLIIKVFTITNKKSGIAALISFTALAILIWCLVPGVKSRFQQSYKSLTVFEQNQSTNPGEGSAQRIVIWKCSLRAIQDNSFVGTGTGDVHETLDEKFMEYGFRYGVTLHRNTHNQYFQTAIALGVIGLLYLIFVFFSLIVHGIRNKEAVIAIIALVFLLHFMVESMLETQAGTVYIAFCISFFGMKGISENKNNSESGH